MSTVAFDPDADRAGNAPWLVVAPMAKSNTILVPGMPVLEVVGAHATRAAAEAAAGLHAEPVTAWLLYDPAIGWRRSAAGLRHYPAQDCELDEATARAVLAEEQGWQLKVRRASGLVTEPNVEPDRAAALPTAQAEVSHVPTV